METLPDLAKLTGQEKDALIVELYKLIEDFLGDTPIYNLSLLPQSTAENLGSVAVA